MKIISRPIQINPDAPIARYKLHIINEICALFFLVLTIILFRSRAFDSFSDSFIGGAEFDSGLYLWLIKTNLKNISEWFDHIVSNPIGYLLIARESAPPFQFWFNTSAFYPYGGSLAWSDNFILPSLIVGGLQATGLSLVQSWNSLILAATLLNGYSTYHLSFRLTGNLLSSLLAGIIFMTWGWFGEHLGHPQLQFAFFIPLVTAAYLKFINKKNLKSALGIGAIIFFALLTTAYYAIFAGFLLLSLTLALLASRPSIFRFRHLWISIMAMLIAAPIFYPFVYPYFDVAAAFGDKYLYETYAFAATGFSYIAASTYSWLYGAKTAILSHKEGHLFPGAAVLVIFFFTALLPKLKVKFEIAPIALNASLIGLMILSSLSRGGESAQIFAILATGLAWLAIISGLLVCYKVNKEPYLQLNLIPCLIFITVFFAIISLGPLTKEGGVNLWWGPFQILFYDLPGANAIRAVSRAGVVVVFAISLLTGLFFNKFPRLNAQVASLKLLLAVLIVVENFNFIFPMERAPQRPEIFTTVAKITNKQDSVFVFPYFTSLDKNYRIKYWQDFAKLNVNYMNWSVDAPYQLINGYSGQLTWFMKEYPRKLANFPDERSIRALSYISNLKYILLLPRLIPDFNLNKFRASLETFKDQLSIKKIDGEGNILLELNSISEIGSEFSVLVPPDRGLRSAISIEVRGAVQPGFPSSALTITESQTGNLISTQQIVHNGKFKRFEIKLNATGETVKFRHLKLNVVNEDEDTQGLAITPKVFVRAPKYEVY
jgi:hypothetical protein